MNKKLSPAQLLVTLAILLATVGFALYRYFAAPAYPGEDPRDKALHNIAVTEIALVFGELAPARVSATEAPRRGGGGGGGGGAVTPKGEAARKEAARYAKEVTPKYEKIVAALRQAGIPVTYEDIEKKAAVGKAPVTLLVTLQGNGTVVEGQPTMGVLGYTVEIKREVYTSRDASSPIRVNVFSQSGSVGVTSPANLQEKQDQAVDGAIKAIIARWLEDNPPPSK